jgi:c-di-AMP phosphodiesterase-like protein
VTYYFTEKEFESEVNDGFFVVKSQKGHNVTFRLKRRKYTLVFNNEGELLSISSNCRQEQADERLPNCVLLVETFIKNYKEYYE